MKKNFLYIAAALLLTACSENSTLDMAGMFSPNGEVVNTRFEQSMAYNEQAGEIHVDMGADEYTVFVCADSHITRQTHQNLDTFIAQYNAAAAPKLAIHLGDLINAQKNFACRKTSACTPHPFVHSRWRVSGSLPKYGMRFR